VAAVESLRTPDDRFEGLPGWSFEPRYVEVDSTDGGTLRVHYVDEGTGPAVLLLHGEPSWAYLYRKMIPVIVDAGLRAIAIDLVGFGRSDKPVRREDYTYARHVTWMAHAVDDLDLQDITLFGQDWGGLIGLRLVAEDPDRYARVVAANTFLPTGDIPLGEAFIRWRDYSQRVEHFDVPWLVDRGCVSDLSEEVKAAYDAPFPDDSYKAAARQFPTLVPATPDDPAAAANRAAWEVLSRWEKPFLTAFSDSDPVTRGADLLIQGLVPAAQGREHPTIVGAGHYLQEDKGEEVARVLVDFVTTT
jgi:haloalkane dehalogenase